MAKKKNSKGTQNTPIRDNTLFWSDITFMPEDEKSSTLWCAQMLFFAKQNGVAFLNTKKANAYRALSQLKLDRQTYVNLIDPPTPMGGGGKAEYFSSDFEANPIDIHLDNIIRAKLDKIGVENKILVNEIDKFAKTQRQRDRDKIIYQREFRALINQVNQEIGLPPIKDSESPYEYVKKLNNEKGDKVLDELSGLIEYIRGQVKDSQDLALYDRYVYKGDIERAFEMGIQHYLINQNKWNIKNEHFIDDLKNFNKACGRWYIDETTGRGNVEYLDPRFLFTSPFYQKDGEDIVYYWYEKDISFAEFVRQFATTMSDEELKEVFEINKYTGASHGLEWTSTNTRSRNAALIRIGYMSVLTQEANKFSEKYVENRNPTWEKKPLSWEPDTESETQKQRIYNVWYSWYYIPPPGERSGRNSQADWGWQSKYIFNIKKDIDMYRYGVDMRYARSTLVIWKDERPSFMDIKQAFMPKIHTNWHKFQNCIVQDMTAVVFDYDLIGAMLNAVDESNKINPGDPDKPTGNNGVDAAMEQWKMLKQGGMGWMKFRDKNGNMVVQDPSKLIIPINSGHLDKAEKYLQLILELYNQMVIALAQNDISQGMTPKPRTPAAGIEASLVASNNGLWFIEKPVREFTIMFAERCVQHILCMVKERDKYGYTGRWDEYKDVVGLANALMVEGIADLDPENIGITVSLEDTTANQQYVFELANKMAANKEIGYEAMILVTETAKHNYKYAYALLAMEVKRRERERADQEELAHERKMEEGRQQLEIAQALQMNAAQAKNVNIQAQGQVDSALQAQEAQLKLQSVTEQKDQLLSNKLMENQQKAELDKQKEREKNLSSITV